MQFPILISAHLDSQNPSRGTRKVSSSRIMEWERKVQCAVTVHTVEGHSGQRREYTVRGPPIVSWAEDDAAGTEQLPKLVSLPKKIPALAPLFACRL